MRFGTSQLLFGASTLGTAYVCNGTLEQVVDLHKLAVLKSPVRSSGPLWTNNTDESGPLDLKTYPNDTAEKPFVVFSPEFHTVLGKDPKLRVVAENNSFPFAHEAGVWFPNKREMIFSSDQYKVNQGQSFNNISISKMKIPEELTDEPYEWEVIRTTPDILTANGGTYYNGGVLFTDQGQGSALSSLVYMDVEKPYKSKVILNNYFGRPLNGPNDVAILPLDGSIWFTDPSYAEEQGLKNITKLPNHVYSFTPKTGVLKVVINDVGMPNGIAFSPDFKIVYVTQYYSARDVSDDSIYAYDVVKTSSPSNDKSPAYVARNKRLFAFTETSGPDGIKIDSAGNVYSGCEDGVHVWNREGFLIGKILIPGGVNNLVFTDRGRLLIFNGNRMFEARLNAHGTVPLFNDGEK